jgi:hypothetical protein
MTACGYKKIFLKDLAAVSFRSGVLFGKIPGGRLDLFT